MILEGKNTFELSLFLLKSISDIVDIKTLFLWIIHNIKNDEKSTKVFSYVIVHSKKTIDIIGILDTL